MSFGGSSSGGSRGGFGGKGASQKKDRKKKQEFHRHKVKYVEEESLDFGRLKERVVLSLQKLGLQVFSAEPGGYSLQDWVKSFNFLLDDFEEKTGGSNLPKEYFAKRQELTAEILKPIDTSDIDQLVEEIRKEEDQIKLKIFEQDNSRRQRLDQEKHSAELKIKSLKNERDKSLLQIEKERLDAERRKTEPEKPPSFFKRLFSKSSSDSPDDRRIKELESRADELKDEMQKLQDETDSKATLADSEHKHEIQDESEKLDALRNRLGELESDRALRMQLSEKRQQITTAMSEIITKIEINSATNSEGVLEK